MNPELLSQHMSHSIRQTSTVLGVGLMDKGFAFSGERAAVRTSAMQPTLRRRVFHIGGLVAEKQVRRIDAARRIATMQDVLIRCNRTMHQHPRGAMGLDGAATASPSDLAVAVGINTGGPQPAGRGLANEDAEPVEKALSENVLCGNVAGPLPPHRVRTYPQ